MYDYKDRAKKESNGMTRVKGACLYNNASSPNRLCLLYSPPSSALGASDWVLGSGWPPGG